MSYDACAACWFDEHESCHRGGCRCDHDDTADPNPSNSTGRTNMPIPGTETALGATNAPPRVSPDVREGGGL